MSSSSINNVHGFDQSTYDSLIKDAEEKQVDRATVDLSIKAAMEMGVDFKTAAESIKFGLPVLAEPDVKAYLSMQVLGGMPSPMAIVASLLVEGSAEERKQNRVIMEKKGEIAVEAIQKEAAEIRRNAVTQLVLGIISATISFAAGALSMTTSLNGKIGFGKWAKEIPEDVINSVSQAISQMIGAFAKGIDSIAGFNNSTSLATQKDFQATAEQARNARELAKAFIDALSELISKIISSYDAVQQNTNQTKARIMG